MKARPTLPFLLLINASVTLGIPALYYLSKEQQGENEDQWLKEGQHKYELGGEEQCNISKKKNLHQIKVVHLSNQYFLLMGFFSKSSTPVYN